MDIKPIFLLRGPQGSGKSKLLQILAKRIGMHLIVADFSEVQSLSSAQTEAKLRIVIANAQNSIPCILMFRNIHVSKLFYFFLISMKCFCLNLYTFL